MDFIVSTINFALKKIDESELIVKNSVHFMQFTVQDLLDSAQLKAGEFKINYSNFNVS